MVNTAHAPNDQTPPADFVELDWEAVLAYQRNPLYLRYNEWTRRTPEAVRDFLRMFLDHQEQEPRLKFQLAVTLKSTSQLIGNCGVRRASVDAYEGDNATGGTLARKSVFERQMVGHPTLWHSLS